MCMICLTHLYDMSHTCVRHVSHMCVSCLTHVCVMSHTCVCHVSHMCASCLTHVCVMSHTCVCHVSHMCMTCQTHVCQVSHMSITCLTHEYDMAYDLKLSISGLQMQGSIWFSHCKTPQHTATHCNTLQHTATPAMGIINFRLPVARVCLIFDDVAERPIWVDCRHSLPDSLSHVTHVNTNEFVKCRRLLEFVKHTYECVTDCRHLLPDSLSHVTYVNTNKFV